MKTNKLYRSLLDKSIGSMLSAIEIYNKPDFNYREETFSILSVNAWELLFKAYWLKINKYKIPCLYETQPYERKDGTKSQTKRIPKKNRTGNYKTINIQTVMVELKKKNLLSQNLCGNIDALLELRDNAIHFTNISSISKPVQELGFACIKNYISIVKKWDLPIDFSNYNLYLMPLAYVDSNKFVDGVFPEEEQNYIRLLQSQINQEDRNDTEFSIAISIDVVFKKGNSIESVSVQYGQSGLEVTLSEEDIKKKYPLTYTEVWKKSKDRYKNFKKDQQFNLIMADIKKNPKLCHIRRLDKDNPKSQKKEFYSSNIFQTLDLSYIKK